MISSVCSDLCWENLKYKQLQDIFEGWFYAFHVYKKKMQGVEFERKQKRFCKVLT